MHKYICSKKIWSFINVHARPESLGQQLACGFPPNWFPRCSNIGVSMAKVVYSACLPLHLLPPKTSWRPERAQSIIFAWPSTEPAHKNGALSLPLLSPYTPTLPITRKKGGGEREPPKFHGYTEVTHRRSKPERGSLFPAQKNTLAIHMWLHVWRCGSQKTTTKVSIMKYRVWLGIRSE